MKLTESERENKRDIEQLRDREKEKEGGGGMEKERETVCESVEGK